MNTELKALCCSSIRMCQRDSDGKRHRSGCYFHLNLPNCKRKVKGVCHTQPRPRAVTNSDHQIPHDTGTALVPTNFYHCGVTSLHLGRTQPKLPAWANSKHKAFPAERSPSLQPGWDTRRDSASLTASPCRHAPPSQGTATTLHWLSCAASPRNQDP